MVWEKQKVLQILYDVCNPNGYIHKGVFGTVWKAKHTLDGSTYAVKQIPIADALRLRKDGIQGLLQEVTSLNKISSENVVKYHFCWVEGPDAEDISLDSSHVPENLVPELTSGPSPIFQPNYLYIQMEYCELDLERWLKLRENLTPETREKGFADNLSRPTYREPTYRGPTYREPTYRRSQLIASQLIAGQLIALKLFYK
jgi:serine/threonine protein kinase